ncbi:hypothetical protein FOZ60_014791 [Perkinsus olseni]|uniref:Uncharacterized protein n=2 Tax=Perkinsus olseni TaxID=32597 RepID=A0A7J6N821_PEROL|nr:hypothetical protein FOZ60_014791 [Perkinsus olseni]
MLKVSRSSLGGAGGSSSMAEQLFPGYKDKIWAMIPDEYKLMKIRYDNNIFENGVNKHKTFQKRFIAYKDNIEQRFIPSQKYRKPSVDWRRQEARGTLHIGRWYEGPNGSDYRPGKTFDRLRQLVPFTEEEWSQRQQHRTWDGVKFVMISWAVWMGWKMTQTYPIVWCEEEEEQLVVADDAEGWSFDVPRKRPCFINHFPEIAIDSDAKSRDKGATTRPAVSSRRRRSLAPVKRSSTHGGTVHTEGAPPPDRQVLPERPKGRHGRRRHYRRFKTVEPDALEVGASAPTSEEIVGDETDPPIASEEQGQPADVFHEEHRSPKERASRQAQRSRPW